MSQPVTESDTSPAAPAMAGKAAAKRSSRVLARRLATGFALVSLVSVIMCLVLESLLSSVATSVAQMQAGEVSIREGLALATAVREQYIHQAHMLVEASHDHMDHYPQWVDRVGDGARKLRDRLPPSEHWRLNQIVADSAELDELFRKEILPAADRKEMEAVARMHHRRAEQLSARAVAQADAIAQLAESSMAAHHHDAIRASRAGLWVGGIGILLVIALSVSYTHGLLRSVLNPLRSLVTAAQRFAGGDFETRVGRIGEGELQEVADACDHMILELGKREARLLHAERMAVIGQFAAGIAHELNNPIGVIRGYLKTMNPEDPTDVLREELQILDDEAAACQRIADDLLAYAKPSELSQAPIDVPGLVKESAKRFIESGEAGTHSIEVDAEPAQIIGDVGRLRQVILNLLRNAVQASPEGASIEVNGRNVTSHSYVLSVSDRGEGVSPADRDRIFEPFFSRRDGGSGLGLAVCYGIVRAHRGGIEARERPGGGATFVVTLPLESSEARGMA